MCCLGDDNPAATTPLKLTGNAAAQTIQGNAGANAIDGGGGLDTLTGNAGNDLLNGGAGNDVLIGGLGNDTFLFNNAPHTTANRDRITDFNVAADTIKLENSVFTALGTATGRLDADLFFKGAAAHDADDRIVYNAATGALDLRLQRQCRPRRCAVCDAGEEPRAHQRGSCCDLMRAGGFS